MVNKKLEKIYFVEIHTTKNHYFLILGLFARFFEFNIHKRLKISKFVQYDVIK